MERLYTLFIIIAALACTAVAQQRDELRAGQVIDAATLRANGIDRYFSAQPISDAVFQRIWLKSFKRDCTTPRSELRYLRVLHANRDGLPQVGELICNRRIADDLLQIFRELFDNGYRIEQIRLIDDYNADDEASMAANNTSCFNFRRIAGSKTLSRHSLGLAIDINPLYNPCLYPRSGKVSPPSGNAYAHNRAAIVYNSSVACASPSAATGSSSVASASPSAATGSSSDVVCSPVPIIRSGDLCLRLFLAHGFIWGGAWQTPKDFQHFEKRLK